MTLSCWVSRKITARNKKKRRQSKVMKPSAHNDGSFTARSKSHHRLRNRFDETEPRRSVSLVSNPRKKKMLLTHIPLSQHFKNVFKSKKTSKNTSKQQECHKSNFTVASSATEEDSFIGKTNVSHDHGLQNNDGDGLMKLIQEKFHQNNMMNQEKNAQYLQSSREGHMTYGYHHPDEINMISMVKSHDCTTENGRSADALKIFSQDKEKLIKENTELHQKNELLNVKQANLELILKGKDNNEQELPKLIKKYKKLQNNYNTDKTKIAALEKNAERYEQDILELSKDKLNAEEVIQVLAKENKILKMQLMTLKENHQKEKIIEKVNHFDAMKKEYDDIKNMMK